MFLFRFNERRNNMGKFSEIMNDFEQEKLRAKNAKNADDYLANGIYRLAAAITPKIPGSNDDSGTHVASLTEAVMGVTSGLIAIASAIENLANAVREHSDE